MAHPRMYDDADPVIGRLREMCLALPDAFEKEAWGECTFRVTGGSMFAMTDNDHHGSGHTAVWVKAPPGVQEMLVTAAPQRFFVPPYVGSKGWVGMRLDDEVDWDEVADVLKDGHAMSVPTCRRAQVPGGAANAPKSRVRRAVPARRKPRAKQRRPSRNNASAQRARPHRL